MFSYRSFIGLVFPLVCDPSEINFCVWCEIRVEVQSYRYLVVSVPFVEKLFFPP